MKKIMQFFEEKVVPVASKLTRYFWLNALKDTMVSIMPFLIVGSLFLLVAYLPIPNWSETVGGILGSGWEGKLTIVTDATFGMMGLFILIGMPYNYAKATNQDVIITIMLALSSFIILTPITDGTISIEWLSSKGMLVNILISILVAILYGRISRLNIAPKMPDSVPTGVVRSFNALVPIFIILSGMLIIRLTVEASAEKTLHELLFSLLQVPLLKLGATLPAIVFAEMLGQFLWFFGIHGNGIVNGVMDPIWLTLSSDNLEAVKQGLEPINIVTKQFKEIYLQMGGSGSTLPLSLMLAFSRSKQLKILGVLALPAAFFNINEPLIFGLPIVLNMTLFIPWLVTTPLMAIITYTAMSMGLVGLTTGIAIPWTTPILASGFLVSGFSGLVLQAILFILGFLIYYPFFKMIEKEKLSEELGQLSASIE